MPSLATCRRSTSSPSPSSFPFAGWRRRGSFGADYAVLEQRLTLSSNSRWVHKVHVALTKILNFPVLLFVARRPCRSCPADPLSARSFLAVETRVRHKRGYLFNAAIKTQRALSSLPRGIPFEGTVDSISEVFERQVTERALAVASIDNPTPEETEAEQATTLEAAASTRSPVTRVRGLGLVRSASYGPGRSVGQHSRMGSLASPLAKMFNVDGGAPSTKGGKGKADKEKEKDDEAATKGLEARLEAIEAAVSCLCIKSSL